MRNVLWGTINEWDAGLILFSILCGLTIIWIAWKYVWKFILLFTGIMMTLTLMSFGEADDVIPYIVLLGIVSAIFALFLWKEKEQNPVRFGRKIIRFKKVFGR